MCQSCDCVADALQWLGEGGGRKEREGGKGREREDSERGWEEREGGRGEGESKRKGGKDMIV